MIENNVIRQIQELLSDGSISQREIGRRLGISNTTVSRVFQAKRKTYREPSENVIEEPEGPVVRCPTCGGRTQMPCVYCRVVELVQDAPRSAGRAPILSKIPPKNARSPEFTIELVGEHLARYREIHDWRARQPNPHFIDIPDDWPWRGALSEETIQPQEN